jgi:hypothetical protein
MSYQKRQAGPGFVTGSTMGPAGTVDFAGLARGAGSGQWSDPDFRPDDSALWINPKQPGGGAIGGILQLPVNALSAPTRGSCAQGIDPLEPGRLAGSAPPSCRRLPTSSSTTPRTRAAMEAPKQTTSSKALSGTATSFHPWQSFAPQRV